MIYHSTLSDDYLWLLILREKQKKTLQYKVPPRFSNARNKKMKSSPNFYPAIISNKWKILNVQLGKLNLSKSWTFKRTNESLKRNFFVYLF